MFLNFVMGLYPGVVRRSLLEQLLSTAGTRRVEGSLVRNVQRPRVPG